ncbi:hypothetical protein ACWD0J_10280 [Streptomyces sp. NPDC003011]
MQARIVVDHGLVQRISSGDTVSRNADHWPGLREGPVAADGLLRQWAGPAIRSTPRARRTRLRAPVQAALIPRRVREMKPVIETIVDDALEDLAATPAGIVDLVPTFALRIPQQVITHLLGLPADLMATFGEAVTGLFGTTASPQDMQRSMDTVLSLLQQLAATRRAELRDDLVSDLIRAACAEEDLLTDEELLDELMLVVIASTETTMHAIRHAARPPARVSES